MIVHTRSFNTTPLNETNVYYTCCDASMMHPMPSIEYARMCKDAGVLAGHWIGKDKTSSGFTHGSPGLCCFLRHCACD